MSLGVRRVIRLASFILIAFAAAVRADAAEHSGRVTFRGAPVPGATVTVTQGEQHVVTSTDAAGAYRVPVLSEGVCTVRVEMFGFVTLTREIAIGSGDAVAEWTLTLRPFAELRDAMALTAAPVPAPPPAADRAAQTRSTDQPQAAPTIAAAAAPDAADNAGSPANFSAADGLLVNGSVNNGAASPFSQLAAFGNNRRSTRSLYNGGLAIVLGNSVWDSRPFSFTQQRAASPAYADAQLAATFGGPLRVPGVRNRPVVFLAYQRVQDHDATAQSGRMPTLAERSGDFSATTDAEGRPVTPIDPQTGLAFPGRQLPSQRLSPQALALLNFYPLPNVDGAAGDNYQAPVLTATDQHNLQARVSQTLGRRDALFGNVSYLRTTTDAGSLFGFEDRNRSSQTTGAVNWSRRVSQVLSVRTRYQFTRETGAATPHFADRANVSADAGIHGSAQDPANWGPPTLVFSNGLTGLTDGTYTRRSSRSDAWSVEVGQSIGRHNLAVGSGISSKRETVVAQQEPRGTFTFAGAFTGSDVADFLLGLPTATSIALGNANKAFRGSSANAYVNDDWRVSPSLTINAGLRWEYESPLVEAQGRLANLDVAPGFSAVAPVVASDGRAPLTGGTLPNSLVRADAQGFEPRTGVAWRPIAGSSLVLRAGYGVYRDTGLYDAVAALLAAQPPFSTTMRAANSVTTPSTMADAFATGTTTLTNTFAVDPDLRVGYAHNWQASAQRDLPGSLTVIATYAGTRGRHLPQEFLPNTYPAGTAESLQPCPIQPASPTGSTSPACPVGFVYLTSNGTSLRHAAELELRRRLRNGLTATLHYTIAKATDDASAFVPVGSTTQTPGASGAGLAGATIAQDWRHLEAEQSRSSFDRRHLLTAEVQYTTGMGIAGAAFLGGLSERLLKGWTITSQLTVGSGLPLTPVFLTPVRGTGVTGSVRASLTGAPTTPPPGYYLNPAAYRPPSSGEWGDAGRNSISGPSELIVNAGLGRSVLVGDHGSIDWRIDATNLLNTVTYSGVNVIVGSPQFGLPNRANAMRRVQASARVRF